MLGKDYDQAQVRETKGQFLVVFLLDIGLIGFLRASSDVYFGKKKINLRIPSGLIPGVYDDLHIKPSHDVVQAYIASVVICYPVAFLLYALFTISRRRFHIGYNRALGQFVDKEEIQEIRARESVPFPVPVLGNFLHNMF
ncbi:unnamed protein product, partial [Amoebophrya sp. A120]|eukprot:GSA120T00002640001.1